MTIGLARDGRGVVRLTLGRADKHNALTAEMMAELTEAARSLDADDGVRVVVLAPEGPSFCAGADLGWMRDQTGASPAEREAQARLLAGMLGALERMGKPLIGRVQGPAYGGGVGLISVCDIVIAVDTARFALTETRLGLLPATISPFVLARIGAGAARRYWLGALGFDAAEARRIGLVSEVVAAEALDAAVEAEVAALLACAPGAVAETKALIRDLAPQIDAAVQARTIAALTRRWASPEAAEGVAAFFDKRKPEWQNG